MKPLDQCHLYTFVDMACLQNKPPEIVTQQLCEGGADIIQLRAKNLRLDEIRRIALAMLPITQSANVGMVINDHVSLAREIGAPLCHLGQEDFSASGCERVSQLAPLGATFKVGLSTHAPSQAQRAIAAGADYLAVGPVYATKTKPGTQPVGLDYVRWAAGTINVPWFAIGGINSRNLLDVMAAGARRVCVLSAILTAPNIVRACQEIKRRLISTAR